MGPSLIVTSYSTGRPFCTTFRTRTSGILAVLRMAYLRCTQCGSKALVAASQCPKCAHPFNLLDARGQRAKLKRCRSCGIMHRVDASCHWCGEVKSVFTWPTISANAMRSAAGVALMITAAAGVWQYAPHWRDLAATARVGGPVEITPSFATPAVSRVEPSLAQVQRAQTSAVMASDSAAGTVSTASGLQGMTDSITWTPAVARTWVNVRSDASRGGQVVGVIKPSSRAMLGTDRAGWRQVRSPDVSGWVDPRLFEADSLRTRGE